VKPCIVLCVAALLGVAAPAQDVAPSERRLAESAKALSPLERALAASRTNGKPVLVIVTAPAPFSQPCQSRWLPDLMFAGGDSFLRALSLVEVAFATREQLRAVLHRVNEDRAESGEIGLLEEIHTRRVWTPIDVEPGPRCDARSDDAEELGRQMEAVAGELERHIFADRDATKRRASIARRGLAAEELEQLRSSLAKEWRADHVLMDRCAWCYREFVLEARGREFGVWNPTFVGLAALRLVDQPPYGARWFQLDGERLRVDFLERDDELERARLVQRARSAAPPRGALTIIRSDHSEASDRMPCGGGPCGTGFTPKASYRFLDEYTRALVSATDLD
jgi:hypothetical protein